MKGSRDTLRTEATEDMKKEGGLQRQGGVVTGAKRGKLD